MVFTTVMTVVHQCRALFAMSGGSPSLSGAMIRDRVMGKRCPTLYAGCWRGFARCSRRVGVSQKRWCEVSFAGMADGDHVAWLLVLHQDIDRREVENVLRRFGVGLLSLPRRVGGRRILRPSIG